MNNKSFRKSPSTGLSKVPVPAAPVAPRAKQKPKPMTRSTVQSRLRVGEEEALQFSKAKRSGGKLHESSDEYRCIAKYFKDTLGATDVVIHGLERCSGAGASRFRAGAAQRIMFHGCKAIGNERAILSDGFKVSQCVSGGRNYGSWFAYAAAYSDGLGGILGKYLIPPSTPSPKTK
jgi:hypothetical protein